MTNPPKKLAVAGLTLAMLGSSAGLATAKAKPKPKLPPPTRCNLQMNRQTAASEPNGYDFGFVTCPPPFGRGVWTDGVSTVASPTSDTHIAGKFQMFFNEGTLLGTFDAFEHPTTEPGVAHAGDVKVTGGTGRFSRIRGGGTDGCATPDAGDHTTCVIIVYLYTKR